MNRRKKPITKRPPRGNVVVVRSVRREPPDLHRLSRALLDLAAEEAARKNKAG